MGQYLPKSTLHVGSGQVAQSGIKLNRPHEPGVPPGLTLEAVQHPALLIHGKISNVAVKHGSERIARKDFSSTGLAMGGEPGGKAAQFRDDYAVMRRHQGEKPPDRQAVTDKIGQVSRGEELRNLAMNRGRPVVPGRLEQFGAQRLAKNGPMFSGYPIQTGKVVIALAAKQSVPGGAGQKLYRTELPRSIHQTGNVNAIRVCYLMLPVVLAKQGSARHIECLQPGLRPDPATSDRDREHSQALGICEQGIDPLLAGRVDEPARVCDTGIRV